jgi:SAM-dependent methyltransferase
MEDKIEILSADLLNQERSRVEALRRLAGSLNIEFGWHYLLDLTWILKHQGTIRNMRFLDAGAGTGVIQWYLADQGAKVISVDRESRAELPGRFRRQFNVQGLRQGDLFPDDGLFGDLRRGGVKGLGSALKSKIQNGFQRRERHEDGDYPGQVTIYNQDLSNLVDIEDASIDAIVAVSSLEHNSPEDLKRVVVELIRVLKPGSALFATLAAGKDKDWFHDPSNGWCYSEATLRQVFELPAEIQSNYDQYDNLFERLRSNEELRNNLASFYFRSGNNGMPWGKWNPQYQPIGICKVKGEMEIGGNR